MIFDARGFIFQAPPGLAFARRILLKPDAASGRPYPVSTSRELLQAFITGIRRVSDADIVILEGSRFGDRVRPHYEALGYDFPRVARLDVADCVLVEVENPLPKPYVLPTIWVPNTVLSCDYLISLSTFKIERGGGGFAMRNLLGLLPAAKYRDEIAGRDPLLRLGLDNVLADLYFTLPFDLGVVEARQRFTARDGDRGEIADYGKVFLGEPYEVDREACQAAGVEAGYLRLVTQAKAAMAAAHLREEGASLS